MIGDKVGDFGVYCSFMYKVCSLLYVITRLIPGPQPPYKARFLVCRHYPPYYKQLTGQHTQQRTRRALRSWQSLQTPSAHAGPAELYRSQVPQVRRAAA